MILKNNGSRAYGIAIVGGSIVLGAGESKEITEEDLAAIKASNYSSKLLEKSTFSIESKKIPKKKVAADPELKISDIETEQTIS